MANNHMLHLKKLGINTYKEAVIYMREDCHICRSEGFEAQARIQIAHKNQSVLATLNTIETDLLKPNEASLSKYAWDLLNAKEGDEIQISHPKPLISLDYIRAKIYGHELNENEIDAIVKDVVDGSLSDIHISAFLAASSGNRLNKKEILRLTQSMIDVGTRLAWPSKLVVDKHCVGGLPGNRTSIIVVPIVTAFGLIMPKTSSRAITSPAGTADTMEVIAPVDLDLATMRKVVERENGCIIWGGSVALSPADDILIRIERALDLDSEGQLVASILSKKIAAGSSHIVLDIPVGPTAKVRTLEAAKILQDYLEIIGKELGVEVRGIFTDGSQPVGRGIGPALEAKDVLAVLQGDKHAPQDLRERALTLAGLVLEFSPKVKTGAGKQLAQDILDSGQAWKKFQAICSAQGGIFEPPSAQHTYIVRSISQGKIEAVDNRYLTRIAKLAGAPKSKAAGVEFLTPIGTEVISEQPLFVIHSETKGELEYAVNFLEQGHQFIQIKEHE
ncbi:MAG: thymidine phosphorylase family protein [Gammaproteobacteria bacterium]|jgi:thymidine phosphorylase|nr:thymidine phosphorylase family protein [Gammaproteobacteria bacterium]